MTTREPHHLLAECGEMLFGRQWRAELGEALDVSERTIRRWAAGASPVPAGAWAEINELIVSRSACLEVLKAEINRLED